MWDSFPPSQSPSHLNEQEIHKGGFDLRIIVDKMA